MAKAGGFSACDMTGGMPENSGGRRGVMPRPSTDRHLQWSSVFHKRVKVMTIGAGQLPPAHSQIGYQAGGSTGRELVMALGKTLRTELDDIKAELARMREAHTAQESEATTGAAGGLHAQIAELNQLVQDMLENAEETITEHPVATVAGALALGIVIGRLTAH
ncbi:MAG: hypothetical protein WCJ41_12590 [Aestuariivirga sp.]|uniref:hypothetical protein n=1 Tax=Aestuariivirga sp. TaxID=2650926 RepID=UPI0030178B0C